jgi:hypothetical protein
MNQLFIVGRDLLKAVTFDDVNATCSALHELNLYALPFDSIDVDFPSDAVIRPRDSDNRMEPAWFLPGGQYYEHGRVIIKNITTMENSPIHVKFYWTSNPKWPGMDITNDLLTYTPDAHERVRNLAANFMIAVLASRNIIKNVKHNKMAKLGIGKCKYEYITTLLVPDKLENDIEHTPTGRTVCPHLRRGHIRRQHHGPNNELIKQVWIAPIFVNADEQFVKSRKAYNMRGPQ